MALQQPELLVSGYSRQYYAKDMPIDIIQLFCLFYRHQEYIWKIKHDDLICCKKNNECLKDKEFDIENCKFQCVLYPKHQYGIMLFIKLLSKPKTIQSVIVYFELNCIEIKRHWRCTKAFPSRFPSGSKISYFSNYGEKGFRSGWVNNTLKLSQINNRDFLTFTYYVEIVRIKYKNGTNKFIKTPKMKTKNTLIWNLNITDNDQFVWSPFTVDKMFYFSYIPNGIKWIKYDEMKFFPVGLGGYVSSAPCYTLVFAVNLVSLPMNVSAIKIKISITRSQLKDNNNNIKVEGVYILDHIQTYSALPTNKIKKLMDNVTSIKCIIEILKIWDIGHYPAKSEVTKELQEYPFENDILGIMTFPRWYWECDI
eukprot:292558_1